MATMKLMKVSLVVMLVVRLVVTAWQTRTHWAANSVTLHSLKCNIWRSVRSSRASRQPSSHPHSHSDGDHYYLQTRLTPTHILQTLPHRDINILWLLLIIRYRRHNFKSIDKVVMMEVLKSLKKHDVLSTTSITNGTLIFYSIKH